MQYALNALSTAFYEASRDNGLSQRSKHCFDYAAQWAEWFGGVRYSAIERAAWDDVELERQLDSIKVSLRDCADLPTEAEREREYRQLSKRIAKERAIGFPYSLPRKLRAIYRAAVS